MPGLVVLFDAAYLLSPPLLALLGAGSGAGAGSGGAVSSSAAMTVASLPAGSRVLLHALDLVHKAQGGKSKRRAVPSVVAGLRAALPPSVLRAAVGREEESAEGEVVDEERELRAWVVRAARAMPLLRVEEEGDGWLGLA